MYTGSVGDGEERGINHFAHEGLIRETFGAHYGTIRKLSPLILENKIKAYNIPQGVIIQLYRALGANLPGIITHVGLETFIDTKYEGGKLNKISNEDYVRKIAIDGKDYLYYKNPGKINYALLRGTEADRNGNISFKNEGLRLDSLTIAIACRNSGGKVIVQVEKLVENGDIAPKDVVLPNILVDYVVVVKDKKNHMQTGGTYYNEDFLVNKNQKSKYEFRQLDIRKIIARRCAMFLNKNIRVLNFGIGIPEIVSVILDEEQIAENYVTTIESGIVGGIAQSGLDFGVAKYPEAIIDATYQFDYYDGGGIDMAFLGMGECDRYGNINVSKLGSVVTGSGGFIDIAQNSKTVIFTGTFTAGGLKVDVTNGRLNIIKEGKSKKFVNNAAQITYAGSYGFKSGQTVYVVTERAVFELCENGFKLIEIAPGINLEKDILEQMEFMPEISHELKIMDKRIFGDKLMGLNNI
jgi:propionate CoA-transferase